MKDLMTTLFGTYIPVTNPETVVGSDGNVEVVDVVVSGLAGVDWPWLCGVALFAVVLYCFLRMVGGLLK